MNTEQTCKLQLIKAEYFGEVEADIYSNGSDMFMTISQLAECLGYASKSGVENILSRNEYLKESEFSTTHVLWVEWNGQTAKRETRVFTEDGIYEVTMLSGQPKAKEFRRWIRGILKGLRSGEMMLTNGTATIAPTVIESALAKMGITPETVMFWNQRMGAIEGLVERAIEQNEKLHTELLDKQHGSEKYLKQIYQHCYPPFQASEWKKQIYEMINKIYIKNRKKYKNKNAILSAYYVKMRDEYGFDVGQARKEYQEKYNTDTFPHTIDLIADNQSLRDTFFNIVVEATNASVQCEPGQSDSISKKSNVVDLNNSAFQKLVELREDNSPHGVITYRSVYKKMMPEKQWHYKMGSYKRKFGIKKVTKMGLIQTNSELKQLFNTTVSEMISDIEKGKNNEATE